MGRIEVEMQLTESTAYLLRAHGGIRSLTAEEADLLHEYGQAIEDYVVERWPVDTGTSRDSFSFTTHSRPDPVLYVFFENPMYYAEFVHLKGEPSIAEGGEPIYATLFREAVDLYRPRLTAELNSAIDQTEAEIARASQDRGRRAATLRAYQSPITLKRVAA